MSTKTYRSKKGAKAAAKKQGFNVDSIEFLEDEEGRWYWSTEDDLTGTELNNPDAPIKVEKVSGPGLKIQKDREEANGVTRPSAGGACAAVWDFCDAFMEETGGAPLHKEVVQHAEEQGWNTNNASIEYYQWRKFKGIRGRIKRDVVAEEGNKEEAAA